MSRPASLLLALALSGALTACGPRTSPAPAVPTHGVVSAVLSTNVIFVGDPVELVARARVDAGSKVEWPELQNEPSVVVRELKSEASASDPSAIELRARITSFKTGEHVLSSNDVVIISANGAETRVPFPFLTLTVESVLGTNRTVRGIKGLEEWPTPFPTVLLMALGAIALLALAIGLLMRRLAKRKASRPPPVLPTADEIANEALDALVARRYIENGQPGPFYTELSSIVRTYIEMRFGLNAPELTTEEFIRESVSSRLLSLDHQMLVAAFLEQSDLVKFARAEPGAPEMNAALAAARRLVDETKAPPLPKEAGS